MQIGLSLSLTAQLRSSSTYAVLGYDPALVFDFKNSYYRKGGASTTFSSAITHARASSATMVNSSGTLVTVGNNVPRTGHHIYNGSAWVNEGILYESEARTNLLLNSGTLSTQSATVAATGNTLSFTGTGTVTLSGVSTVGPLVGTGTGENNRVSLTFTPTAGTLTLTVSGTVTNAQLEAGSTPSSYIPTTTATATRAAETLTVPAANLPYNNTNMSIQMDGKMTYANTTAVETVGFFKWYLNSSVKIVTRLNTNGARLGNVYTTGVGYNLTDAYLPGVNVPFNIAARYGSTFTNLATDGTAYTVAAYDSASANLSSTDLNLGDIFMGTIGQFRMWDEDLTDAGIVEAST